MTNADPRIRERLASASSHFSLDEDLRLEDVMVHGARRASRQRVAAMVVAVVVAAAAVAIAWYALPRHGDHAPQPLQTPPIGAEPTGFMVTAIDGTDTWPPPLTAVSGDGTGSPIDVPTPRSASDWDWSPDGTRLLWLQYINPIGSPSTDRLFLGNADGSDPIVLVDDVSFPAYRGRAWSADSRSIAFIILKGNGTDLYVTDATTGATSVVAHWDRDVLADVDWSPDGSRLVVALPDEGIVTMNPDGTDVRKISDLAAFHVGWSPTGNVLVAEVQSRQDVAPSVWVLNADGSDPVKLTPRGIGDTGPVWSPDGAWIAFSRDTSDEHRDQPEWGTTVFLIRPDGSDEHKVLPIVENGWREVWDWVPVAPPTKGD